MMCANGRPLIAQPWRNPFCANNGCAYREKVSANGRANDFPLSAQPWRITQKRHRPQHASGDDAMSAGIQALRRRAAELGLRLRALPRARWAGMPVRFTLTNDRGHTNCASLAEAKRIIAEIMKAAP